jgi:hypothetical protein
VSVPDRVRLALLLVVGTHVGACSAILTKPQVDAVHDFAEVATKYPRLPASVIRAYENVHASRTVLRASAALSTDASASLEQLHGSLEMHRKVSAAAGELDAALDVLDRYATALGTLSSDQPLDDLDGAAEALGKGIDTGVAMFNSVSHDKSTPLPAFGGAAAAVVRAAGGVLVRHRQAAYLRRFIVQADPTIQLLVGRISVALKEYFDPSQPAPSQGLLPAEKESLDRAFITYCSFEKTPLNASDVGVFYRALQAEDVAEELVTSTLRATEKLGSAHKELVASTSPQASVDTLLAEVKALAKEVQAGAKAKGAVGD